MILTVIKRSRDRVRYEISLPGALEMKLAS